MVNEAATVAGTNLQLEPPAFAAANLRFELTDHLGTVRAVVTGAKNANGSVIIVSLTDYYPYGLDMPGRTYMAEVYRYGYQGSERDPETLGGAGYTTFFRALDPRIGRWLTPDPKIFPWQSPYCSMDCNPVALTDVWGAASEGGPKHGDQKTKKDGSVYEWSRNGYTDKDKWHQIVPPISSASTPTNNTFAIQSLLLVFQIHKNVDNAIDWGLKQFYYFGLGGVNAWASDNLLGYGYQDRSNTYDDVSVAYHSGQVVGHLVSMVSGTVEMVAGGGGELLGGGLVLSGIGTVPGLTVIAGSTVVVVHGGSAAWNGTTELAASAKQVYYAIKSSGSDQAHNGPEGKKQSETPKYENPGHHDPSGRGPNLYDSSKSVLPANHEDLWKQSKLASDGNRWTKVGKGNKAVYHRFQDNNVGKWHWNGSTNGVTKSGHKRNIKINNVPNDVIQW